MGPTAFASGKYQRSLMLSRRLLHKRTASDFPGPFTGILRKMGIRRRAHLARNVYHWRTLGEILEEYFRYLKDAEGLTPVSPPV